MDEEEEEGWMMNDSPAANLWITRDGRALPASMMDTDHIINVVRLLERKDMSWHPIYTLLSAILIVRESLK